MKQQMVMQLLAGMAPADRQTSRLTQKKEVEGKVLLIANLAVWQNLELGKEQTW